MSTVIKRATDKEVPAPKDMKKKLSPSSEKEKQTEKTADKATDKKPIEKTPEKTKEESKGEKSAKDNKEKDKTKQNGKPDKKDTVNGRDHVHNGVTDVTLNSNGTEENVLNGSSVSLELEEEDALVIVDNENDELFPELTYDDTSDADTFERDTPDTVPSRSVTRRSQVKSTRTPETPRPASDKQTDKDKTDTNVTGEDKLDPATNAKDSKLLKLKEDAPPSSDRKLRSSEKVEDNEKGVDGEGSQERRDKTDTNYSRSRVKVSPYRRHDASTLANYSGNNTTMEMDITSSFTERSPGVGGAGGSGGGAGGSGGELRRVRGRESYKRLERLDLKVLAANKAARDALNVTVGAASGRPTGHVVGRKRRPIEMGSEPEPDTKRVRLGLLQRVLSPLHTRRAPPIVGINSDLPLSAPVSASQSFDPETITGALTNTDKSTSSKQRCILM